MTKEQDNYDRNLKKTQKIVLFVVVPVLVLIALGIFMLTNSAITGQPYYTNFFNFGKSKLSDIEIIKKVDLHCYNVNWFGTNGFQITYKDTLQQIADQYAKQNRDFVQSEFFNNKDVKDYLVTHCPHIDSKLQAPKVFDPKVGVGVVDKCLQIKRGTINYQDYCAGFIRK